MFNIKKMIDDLIDILKIEINKYEFLLITLKDEKKAIISNNITKLIDNNEVKEILVRQIAEYEEKRKLILNKIALSHGLSNEELTVSKLSEYNDLSCSDRLNLCRSKLFYLIEKVTKANNLNKSLLNHSIELVRGSISLLNNLIASESVYYETGMVKSRGKSGRVISQEA